MTIFLRQQSNNPPQMVHTVRIFVEMQQDSGENHEIIGYICNSFTPPIPKPALNEQNHDKKNSC